jgi:hypothetical protein
MKLKNLISYTVRLLIITSYFFLIKNANSAMTSSYIGTSWTYANVNYPEYKFTNEYEAFTNPKQNVRSINYGQNIEFDNKLFVNGGTNRFLNKDVSRAVIHIPTNTTMFNKTKITTDYILLGKRYNKLLPAISLINMKVDKKLYKNNNHIGRQKNHALLYGFGVGYLLTEKVNASVYYIAPNKELGLTSAFTLSIYYNF